MDAEQKLVAKEIEGYDTNGIDVERLRANLRLTLEERIEKHRRACESLIFLRHVAASTRPTRARRGA